MMNNDFSVPAKVNYDLDNRQENDQPDIIDSLSWTANMLHETSGEMKRENEVCVYNRN